MLVLDEVSRSFGPQKFPAVVDVSLKVVPGTIHALLGPNGAGKTTTVRMCATLLRPTTGTITVNGIDVASSPEQARKHIGLVLGGDMGFYPRATCEDNLLYFADLQGVSRRQRRARVNEALESVGLEKERGKRTQELSRGLKQRLHLARALLSEPTILLLDEPTNGLDPDVSLRIRDLLTTITERGTGILLTSHSMAEIEELSDTISLIGAGRLVASGDVSDIAAFAGVSDVSTFTVPAAHKDLGDRLESDLQGLWPGVQVTQRAQSSRWVVQIYWPTRGFDAAHGAERSLSLDTLVRESVVRVLGGDTAATGLLTDLLTRPASLEQAYLAAAERLAR